ncbi:2-oxoglutarate dehydrogenase complex dihydrolipoyllysine-residue succinyltransferase [Paenibacillus cymbidii]|uniref:2-oxoglutarate dehydrogenase complex dihydrolipoyllysine-residue succinyltransferase n=1 Tax=Paenibacillus cymbidii TaxID=1639034 RepID=UPI0010821B45|nr:2-oxoglutarate dehydrogenase complex dihydrolipoyllysine-residue succinyltransferase [Paenibacillus cymbidii]
MADIKVPEMGESIAEGTVAQWMVKEGDTVRQGDLLLELETDKVNLQVNATEAGVIGAIAKREGDIVRAGDTLGTIRSGSAGASAETERQREAASPAREQPQASGSAATSAGAAAEAERQREALAATPSARKLARERGVDWQRVTPSDPGGRITRDDVANAAEQAPAAPAPAQPAPAPTDSSTAAGVAAAAPAAPAGDAGKPVETVRMSRRRQTIASRLVEAQRTAAMLTTFNEVDMTNIMELRKRRKQSFQEKHEVGLGFMSFFTKAVVGALKAFPLLNAEIEGDSIHIKKFYDIGIAVAAKEGLVVPVVRDADRLSFAEIEKRIADLANRARSNTLQLTDLQGGTFSITNGGVFGSLLSTPILNTPQVGILGMHKIQWRPIALDEERMANRPMMYVALSYDHRIVDGAEAVRFLVTLKEMLEDPETLLLEG